MFKQKYSKYKEKYLELKKQIGGDNNQLLLAAKNNDSILVKEILDQGADVNATDRWGATPLILTTNVEIAELLIDKGANINAIDKDGATALILTKNDTISELLIKKGANVNATDKDGNTPLILTNNIEIAKLLIENGANVNAKDKRGNTALIYTLLKRIMIDEDENLKKNEKIAKLLIESGADVNYKDPNGNTALFLTEDDNLEIIKLLIEKGADIRNKKGNVLLINASINNDLKMVQLLIEKGVDVNAINNDGLNAYFIACQNMNDDIAKLLIDSGANITLKNSSNQQCIIKTNKIDIELESVPIKTQMHGDCFAHAVARNFVRTLQILGIIKRQYNNQFYDLFYSIINRKFSCYGNDVYNTSTYLLDYLSSDIQKIFNIDIQNIVCNNIKDCEITSETNTDKILKLTEEDKESFINDMNQIKNLLYVIRIKYIPNENLPNYPSLEIKNMLNQKLQPIVTFQYSTYVADNQWKKKSNLVPTIIKQPLLYNHKSCNYTAHAVNLRKWMQTYVEFKNSWGTDIYNSGNFSVADINQLTCRNNNNNNTDIYFDSLMFDELLLPKDIQEKYIKIKNSLYDTCDIGNYFPTNNFVISIHKIPAS